MIGLTLTNLIQNGSFESGVAMWNGYMTNNQNAQSALSPTRVSILSPGHGEIGTYSAQIGTKTQGLVYMNPTTQLTTVVGHKYYIRSQVRLRGATAGVVSVCTVQNGQSIPQRGTTALTPLTGGLQTTNTTSWQLIDAIWTADTTAFNPRWIWQTTANSGNNDLYGQLDNVVIIDLTQEFGAGNEPPMLAMRNFIITEENGWWEGTIGDASTELNFPEPPDITTVSIPLGLHQRAYSTQINITGGTSPFTFSITGLPAGHGLSIDNTGLITGTMGLTEGTYSLTVQVADSVGYLRNEVFTLNVADPPEILDEYIPGAILNVPYSWTPSVDGSDGNLIVTVVVTGGTIPTGLSINGSTISGTPTVDGQSCQITVSAYNDYDLIGVSRQFTLGVFSAPRINTVSPLPNATLNASYSRTFTASGVTPITWQVLSGSLPSGIELNVNTGVISGIPEALGTYSFSVRATNDLGTDTQLYTLSVYELPVIMTTTLGYARLGSSYSGQITANGSTPITYAITNGQLPNGLSFNGTTGQITGTPNTTGTFSFTVVATNIVGSSTPVVLQIEAGLALAIVTASPLRNGTVGVSYGTLDVTAEGFDGSTAQSWSWVAQSGSSFPPGLILTSTTLSGSTANGNLITVGRITGTPSQAGTYNVNITVTNGAVQATTPFTITIGTPPVITTNPLLGGSIDRPFTAVLQASGTTPITWAITAGPTPNENISLSSNGVLSWLIPIAGEYAFTIVATNTFGGSVPVDFTLIITTPSIIDVTLPDGIVGIPWTYTFSASGEPPFTWTMPSGSLPAGLLWDAGTATISGTPSAVGTSNFQIRATNIGGYAQEPFSITIYQRPSILTAALNSGNVSASYTQTLTASGTTPITWSIVTPSGSETGLPPGLNLSGATITGTPTTQGTYTFTVQALNATGSSYADTKQFSIIIGPSGAPVITTGANLSATRGVPYTVTITATGDSPISFASLDTLPNGLSLSGAVLSGTPMTAGTFQFRITASNSSGNDVRTFTMIVADPPTITTASLPNGTLGEPYNQQVQATGDSPITWQIMTPQSGETGLPSGLSITSNSGVISGTPNTSGVYTFRIRATNGSGYDTIALSITVVAIGGTFINGDEIENMFIDGPEIGYAFIDGYQVYKA